MRSRVLRRLINAGGARSARQVAVIGGSGRTLISSCPLRSVLPPTHVSGPAISTSSSFASLFHVRTFSSSSAGNVCLIQSEEQFSSALNKIQDESSPAILYFTAVWCPPCRFMSPVLEELSGKYPHVTTYKIDIDQPRLHFFKDGKKVDEIIGADIERLKYTMERLYE
ncbi:thioredoxin O1, mitochondrial isoform X2 [Punica granatum]|uniref:Thioredoxin O1, mitochondrial isoform X2 n=1 Tax=Punica granatum TaxID=22663 RepID=A0A6P8DMU7_PUNGR|nr:thioredoxin O1, mitochondrial isoform X2 [Punica granatum]